MKLVIVESPNKAKIIQEYLGKDYIVLASMGHICDLASGGRFGIGIDIANNFKPTYVLAKDKVHVLSDIINASNKCDEILLMSDMDREGESIAYHIRNYLLSTGKPIRRVELGSEITKTSIKKSVENLRDINMNLFASQEARRILDRIVGFMVSPYLINYYGQNLSAGRVQSVAVRMIADREKEIEIFKPEEYWNIYAKFVNKDNQSFISKYYGKITDKNTSDTILNSIKNSEFTVATVASQKKKEFAPPPMTTAALQQYMASKFSFEPDRTMKAAQDLYESGHCTYIRTDSIKMSDDAISSIRDYLTENNFEIPKKPNVFEVKDTAQAAHECIRPTNMKNKPSLNGDQKDLYDIIWKFAVASQMNPAIWDTLNVKIQNKDKISKIVFTASGKALFSKGFLEIFGDVDPGQIDIPNLTEGDDISLAKNEALKSEQKFTKPAARFNNATLLKELEDKQIGRPATFAEIIKKITARNYVEKKGSTYRPTELGSKITDILSKNFSFLNVNFTASLEHLLDKIESGEASKDKVLKDFFSIFNKELMKTYAENSKDLKFKCRKCDNFVVEKEGKFGKFYLCINNACKNTENSNFYDNAVI